MIEVTSKMEFYFPDVQSNTDSWNNIHAILCHATHAYTSLKKESEQLKIADLKISVLEEQIKTLDNDVIKEKTKQKINALLKTLTLEVEEELKESIYELGWFVQPESGDMNHSSLYNPRVGSNDYKKVLGKICFHYIFNQSRKFPEKFKNTLRDRDMSRTENKVIVWKYMWIQHDLGKKVSSELNHKRNAFVHTAKTAFELILTVKNNTYSLNFILTLSKWISNPTFSCDEFHVIKNTLFVVIAATKSGGKYHHNNILSVLDQNQKEDEDGLYFSSEVIKMTDGIRMFEKLSINDVALTCVSLQNCIQICVLRKESSICDEIVFNNGTDMVSIKSNGSEKNSYALTSYCSQYHSVTSESSKGMSWNEHLRKKPENCMEVCGVEAYNTIKN